MRRYSAGFRIEQVITSYHAPINIVIRDLLHLVDGLVPAPDERHLCNQTEWEKKLKYSRHLCYQTEGKNRNIVEKKLKEKYAKPLIVTVRGYDIYDLPFRDQSWFDKISSVISNSDKIISVSRRNSSCVNKLVKGKDSEIIFNGFNLQLVT